MFLSRVIPRFPARQWYKYALAAVAGGFTLFNSSNSSQPAPLELVDSTGSSQTAVQVWVDSSGSSQPAA